MSDLVKSQELYTAMEKSLQNVHFEIHAIYEPDGDSGWHCAAVDLFRPGMTFRLYFTLRENHEIYVEHMERWYFG